MNNFGPKLFISDISGLDEYILLDIFIYLIWLRKDMETEAKGRSKDEIVHVDRGTVSKRFPVFEIALLFIAVVVIAWTASHFVR